MCLVASKCTLHTIDSSAQALRVVACDHTNRILSEQYMMTPARIWRVNSGFIAASVIK